jgi:Cu/Ag efflux pump CusA
LVVFLCLAALYESWSVPLAVLLVVPIGLLGAVLAVFARGLQNDVFFQVGLLTTMGISAKNAISSWSSPSTPSARARARSNRRWRQPGCGSGRS